MPHDQGLLEPGRPGVGVASKGRGFAPAGRGRGIAKWSSQGNVSLISTHYMMML